MNNDLRSDLAQLRDILAAELGRMDREEASLRRHIAEPFCNLDNASRQLSELRGRKQGVAWSIERLDLLREGLI